MNCPRCGTPLKEIPALECSISGTDEIRCYQRFKCNNEECDDYGKIYFEHRETEEPISSEEMAETVDDLEKHKIKFTLK